MYCLYQGHEMPVFSAAGQTFGGSIYADKVCAEKILEAVNALGEVRMGYGKSSEFGAVDFVMYDI